MVLQSWGSRGDIASGAHVLTWYCTVYCSIDPRAPPVVKSPALRGSGPLVLSAWAVLCRERAGIPFESTSFQEGKRFCSSLATWRTFKCLRVVLEDARRVAKSADLSPATSHAQIDHELAITGILSICRARRVVFVLRWDSGRRQISRHRSSSLPLRLTKALRRERDRGQDGERRDEGVFGLGTAVQQSGYRHAGECVVILSLPANLKGMTGDSVSFSLFFFSFAIFLNLTECVTALGRAHGERKQDAETVRVSSACACREPIALSSCRPSAGDGHLGLWLWPFSSAWYNDRSLSLSLSAGLLAHLARWRRALAALSCGLTTWVLRWTNNKTQHGLALLVPRQENHGMFSFSHFAWALGRFCAHGTLRFFVQGNFFEHARLLRGAAEDRRLGERCKR